MPDSDYTRSRFSEMDAGFAGHSKRARSSLGVESFGLSVLEFSAHWDGYPEHDHHADGQEEVYLALEGDGTIVIDGQTVQLDRESLVRVGPLCRRKVLPGANGIRLLVMGGVPGRPYSAPAFSESGAPDGAKRSGPAPG